VITGPALQWVADGQVLSPPPVTVALLLRLVPLAAGSGVTGITKLTLVPAAMPPATVQVTTWLAAVQAVGKVPIVKVLGIVSLIVAATLVDALPVFVSVSV
jgi:predicted phage tail protein